MKRAKILSLALVVVLLALVIALFTIPAAAEETLPEAGQVMTEDVVTEYGTIPKEYANQTDYPFVLFDKNGSFVSGYSCWMNNKSAGDANRAGVFVSMRDYAGGTILLRRDYSIVDANEKWMSHLNGTMTIDLGGFTLNPNSCPLFYVRNNINNKNVKPTYYVKNGFIKLTTQPLVQALAANADRVVNINFEKVTFSITQAETNFLNGVESTGTNAITNVTFTDCKFDMTSSGGKTKILKSADTTLEHTFNVYINGGEFINMPWALDFFTMLGNDTLNAGIGSDGKYPTATFVYGNARQNFINRNYVFNSQKGKTAYFIANCDTSAKKYSYTMEPAVYVEEYDMYVPERVSDPQEYPFIVIENDVNRATYNGATDPVINYFYSAETHWFGSTDGKDSGVYGVLQSVRYVPHVSNGVTVLLRRDFDNKEQNNAYKDKWIGHFNATVNIDLNGYSITTSAGTQGGPRALLYTFSYYNNRYPIYNFFNGDLIVNNSPIIEAASSANSNGLAQTFAVNFENVNFGYAEGATEDSFIRDTSGSKNGNSQSTFKFTNCKLDLTNSPNDAVAFDLANNNTHTINLVFNGSNVVSGNSADRIFYATDAEASQDTLSFARVDGKYLSMELPKGAAAPAGEYVGENGATLVFKKTGETETTTIYELQLKEIADVNFIPKTSVTLGSELTLNIYVPYIDELVSFGIGDESATPDQCPEEFIKTLEDGKQYMLVSLPFSAFAAAENIEFSAVLQVGANTYTGRWTMGVVPYAQKLLAMDGITATEKALAKDMLAYIRSAYAYNDATVSAIDNILGNSYETAFDITEAAPTQTVPGLNGATFVLESIPAVRFYFNEYAFESFTFKVGNRILTESDIAVLNDEYVEFSLYAYEMTEIFSYTIDVAEGDDIEGAYNLVAYYAFVSGDAFVTTYPELADKQADLTELVACFYSYCASAKAYRNN